MRIHLSKAAALTTIVIALGVVALYAGLLPLGSWRDEFFQFHDIQQHGFQATVARLRHWSPRPLSEMLIYAYAEATNHVGRPLVTPFLAAFWALLLGAVLWPAWRHRTTLLAAVSLLAMMLLGHPVAEVFYWPVATAAYLPTVAAAAAILAIDFAGISTQRAGRTGIWLALLVASASSEVGALFTAIYAPLIMATSRRGNRRPAQALGVPLLLALTVLIAEYGGRVSTGIEVLGDPALAHHPLMVMRALVANLPYALIKGDDSGGASWALVTGMTSKLLFALGLYFLLSARRGTADTESQRMRLALGVASLATAALTLAASYYNFGVACCERHDTMRQIYVIVALGSAASWLAARWPSPRHGLGAPVLLLALSIPLSSALPKLLYDYRHYDDFLVARISTWQSGHGAGPTMQITQAPSGHIVGGAPLPNGEVARTSKGMAGWIVRYFGKQSAIVVPAQHTPGGSDARR